MLSLIIDRYLKNPKLHNEIIRYSFFVFNGITTGVLMNDVMRVLIGGDFKKDMAGYATGAAIMSSGYIHKRLAIFDNPHNNIAFGSGFMVGNYWANRSEKGERIV